MPNIIEYSASPDQTVHPSDVGERASVQAAYKLSQTADQTAAKIKQGFGEVGRMVTDYQNLQKHKDLANGMAGLATAESTAYDQAQDKMKEPGFSDQADAPQQIADIYKAQSQKVIDAAPAGEVRDALIEHDSQRQLARHTQALTDLANVSKAQADIAANQLVTSLAGLAAKDPTQAVSLAQGAKAQFAAIIQAHPNMGPLGKAEATAKYGPMAQGKIMDAGLGAMAVNHPDAAIAMLNKLPPDLAGTVDATHITMLAKEAKTQARQDAVLARENANLARQETARKVDAQFATRMANTPPGQPMDPSIAHDAMVAASKGLIPLDHAHTIGEIAQSRVENPQVTSDMATKKEFYDRAALPEGDPNRLTINELNKAEADGANGRPGGLSRDDVQQIGQLQARGDRDPLVRNALQDFAKTNKDMAIDLNPKIGMGQQMLPGQSFKLDAFNAQARTKLLNGLQRGLTVEELVHDPNSKNWIYQGYDKALSVTPDQSAAIMAEFLGTGGVTPPRYGQTPGEEAPTPTPTPTPPRNDGNFDPSTGNDLGPPKARVNETPRGAPAVSTPGQSQLDSLSPGMKALVDYAKGNK